MTTREDSQNFKKATMLTILAISLILLLVFIGIPLVSRLTAYLSDLRSGNSNSSNDITPPAPPRFNISSEYFNKKNVDIVGNAEPSTTVKLNFNGSVLENITDKSGNFTFNIDLIESENTIFATATDPSGNVSIESKKIKLYFDDKPPILEIVKPQDGTSLFGLTQRQITIEGKTESNSQVTINDRFVNVDSEGIFQFSSTMNEGQNSFLIKVVDQAGNTNEKNISVNFTP